uniref:Egg protein n=1 Tax=Rhabditophanes sp. KR3021 TaxID=114890 RepID=A0AC35TWX8_9BILA
MKFVIFSFIAAVAVVFGGGLDIVSDDEGLSRHTFKDILFDLQKFARYYYPHVYDEMFTIVQQSTKFQFENSDQIIESILDVLYNPGQSSPYIQKLFFEFNETFIDVNDDYLSGYSLETDLHGDLQPYYPELSNNEPKFDSHRRYPATTYLNFLNEIFNVLKIKYPSVYVTTELVFRERSGQNGFQAYILKKLTLQNEFGIFLNKRLNKESASSEEIDDEETDNFFDGRLEQELASSEEVVNEETISTNYPTFYADSY